MTCFGDLFARYRDKVMELCVDQAWDEKRPFCSIDPGRLPDEDPCDLCTRHCHDDGFGQSHTCDSAECRELWGWYWLPIKEGGGKRRAAFKQLHGALVWQVPRELRREAILAARLLHESREKAHAAKPRLRVAA